MTCHLPGVATQGGGYPLDVQLMRPGGPVRSCMILEEARLVSSYYIKLSFELFIVSQETQSSLTWFQREKAITSPDRTGSKVYYQSGNV